MRRPEGMDILASAGEAHPSAADESAADTALELAAPTHGGTYPTERARYDFWPAQLGTGEILTIGVNFTRSEYGRPEDVTGYIEAVCGYLRAASRR